MVKLIISRILSAIPLLLALSLLTFVIVQLIPGSVAQIILGESASEENIATLEAELGLDDPLPAQYFRWLTGAVQGDFGESYRNRRPVSETIVEKFPASISLTLGALLIGVVVGILSGVLASLRPGSLLDRMATTSASVGVAIPSFWLAILLSIYLATNLGWFPVVGYTPLGEDPIEWAHGLILPSIALGIPSSALIARQMRASLTRVLQSNYILALRASGIPEQMIVLKHGLKNAMIPVTTVIGFQIPVILGGAFVVETVFAIPGLGSTTVSAVLDQDIPVVQAAVMLTGLFVVVTNLMVDISYGWLNPKVRLP